MNILVTCNGWETTHPAYRERVITMALRECVRHWELGMFKAICTCIYSEKVAEGLTVAIERIALRLIMDTLQPVYPDEGDALLIAWVPGWLEQEEASLIVDEEHHEL